LWSSWSHILLVMLRQILRTRDLNHWEPQGHAKGGGHPAPPPAPPWTNLAPPGAVPGQTGAETPRTAPPSATRHATFDDAPLIKIEALFAASISDAELRWAYRSVTE